MAREILTSVGLLLVLAGLLYVLFRQIVSIIGDINPYWERSRRYAKHFLVEGKFTTPTFFGFRVGYSLSVCCKRVDNEAFNREKMLDITNQKRLLDHFSRRITPHLRHSSWFLALPGWLDSEGNLLHTNTHLLGCVTKDGDTRRVAYTRCNRLRNSLSKLQSNLFGCHVHVNEFAWEGCDDQLIEENYAMITREDKELIIGDGRLDALEEKIAVAALKRQKDLLEDVNHTYETDEMVIKTIKAGRGVKILWELKEGASEYELVGFRKTGGFSEDATSQKNNGMMVVHTQRSGEVVEHLVDGEAYFYTFILRRVDQRNGGFFVCIPIRFQVTISAKAETEALARIIQGHEKRLASSPRENMAQVIKELDLVMEFHDVMDSMEQSLIEKIRAKGLPKNDEEEKIEFVRDAVRLQREKYQP